MDLLSAPVKVSYHALFQPNNFRESPSPIHAPHALAYIIAHCNREVARPNKIFYTLNCLCSIIVA